MSRLHLVWNEETELQNVVDVLNVINPHGYNADMIKSTVEREFYSETGLTSYVGTGGWYVVVYQSLADPNVWLAKPMLMPYSVKRYLIELRNRVMPLASDLSKLEG